MQLRLNPISETDWQDPPILRLSVRLKDGERRDHDAIPGLHLVELMRAHEVPVKAECGGAGVCATCHIRIPAAWRDLLPPPTDEELAKLDEIPGADESSRLACQITMTDELDGLEIDLQHDSELGSVSA
ncbi:MAG: 2Fe-2S iron-sulfur cluster binding domain-containing protein [Hyphomicrobiaceae bacterium]|nr:2Fe-2S iron-sulfur cluster binding domain-containing protein [Hyphomicrobiaceae bacterium]